MKFCAGWNNLIHRISFCNLKNYLHFLHSFSLSILAFFSTAFSFSIFLPLCALSFFLSSIHYPCSLSYNLSPFSCLPRIPTCPSSYLTYILCLSLFLYFQQLFFSSSSCLSLYLFIIFRLVPFLSYPKPSCLPLLLYFLQLFFSSSSCLSPCLFTTLLLVPFLHLHLPLTVLLVPLSVVPTTFLLVLFLSLFLTYLLVPFLSPSCLFVLEFPLFSSLSLCSYFTTFFYAPLSTCPLLLLFKLLHQQFKFFTFLELPLKEYLPRKERNFFVPYTRRR